MKLTCNVATLREAFSRAARFAPSKSPKPILQNVLMTIQDGRAFLSATDLSIAYRAEVIGKSIDGDISNVSVIETDHDDSLVLPTRFGAALASLPADAKVEIASSSDNGTNSIKVWSGRWTAEYPSEDPTLFPYIGDLGQDDKFKTIATVSGSDLRKAIRRTTHATDVASTRYALGGCLLEMDADRPGYLALVATNGRVLAKSMVPITDVAETPLADSIAGTPLDTSVTSVPSNTVASLAFLNHLSSLIDDDEPVTLRLQPGYAIIAEQAGWLIYGRLVEGRFPKYQEVFPDPKSVRFHVKFLSSELLTSVDRVGSVMLTEDSRGIDFLLQPPDTLGDSMIVSGATADRGQSSDTVAVEYQGDSPEKSESFTISGEYIRSVLGKDAPESFTIEFVDYKNAIVMRGDDGLVDVVVMPLTRER